MTTHVCTATPAAAFIAAQLEISRFPEGVTPQHDMDCRAAVIRRNDLWAQLTDEDKATLHDVGDALKTLFS